MVLAPPGLLPDTAARRSVAVRAAGALVLFLAGSVAAVAVARQSWFRDTSTGSQVLLVAVLHLLWLPPAVAAVRIWADLRTNGGPDPVGPSKPAQGQQQHAPEERTTGEISRRVRTILAASEVLEVVLQPIIDIDAGRAVGYEALARFRTTPYRSPDQWFAEAWDIGMGVELELTAVEAALRLLPRLPEDCYLAINVSPQTASSGRLGVLIADVDAGRVVLELTEHEAVTDYGHLRESLRQTRARVAVDDAGAGFASLAHVLNLHPEIIKLDRDLTSSIDDDVHRRALAASLVAFGNEVDAVIIAEGVETQAEADCLRALGVQQAQGFLFGRPAPLPITVG